MPGLRLSETGETSISQGANIAGKRVKINGDDTSGDIHVTDGVRKVDNTTTVESDGEGETIKLKEDRGEFYEQGGKRYKFVKRTATGKYKYVLIGETVPSEATAQDGRDEPAVGSPEWKARLRQGIAKEQARSVEDARAEILQLPTFDSVREQFPDGSIVLNEISGRIREIGNKKYKISQPNFQVREGWVYLPV